MEPAHLVRAARRLAGVSQRELAERAEVSSKTVADVERGAVAPNAATLDRLLAAAGAELTLDRRLPAPCRHLQRHLRLTLTQRLYLAVGGRWNPVSDQQLGGWAQLWRLSRQAEVHVVGAAAVGVWVPLVEPRPVVHAWWHRSQSGRPECPDLDVTTGVGQAPAGAVPVALHGSRVFVLPPDLLLLGDLPAAHRLPLRAAARLLHERGGLDDAGRRGPAHRDAVPQHDRLRVMHTKRFGDLPLPRGDAGRGWQADGAVSLAQWLRRHGYPT